MLDVAKVKCSKLTKQEYRKHIIDTIEAVREYLEMRVGVDVECQKLYFELAKELYRIDNEGENES